MEASKHSGSPDRGYLGEIEGHFIRPDVPISEATDLIKHYKGNNDVVINERDLQIWPAGRPDWLPR